MVSRRRISISMCFRRMRTSRKYILPTTVSDRWYRPCGIPSGQRASGSGICRAKVADTCGAVKWMRKTCRLSQQLRCDARRPNYAADIRTLDPFPAAKAHGLLGRSCADRAGVALPPGRCRGELWAWQSRRLCRFPVWHILTLPLRRYILIREDEASV